MTTPELEARIAGPLVTALFHATTDAEWIATADGAALEAAFELADLIDVSNGWIDVADLGMLIARLLRILDRLGLTPAGREQIDTGTEDDADAVRELRAIAGGRGAG